MAENQQSDAGSSGGATGGSNISTQRELLDSFTEQGVQQMFAVETLPGCEHLDQVDKLPERGLDCNDPCEDCANKGENWVCLICYMVFCSRYVKEHMVRHGETTQHPVVLSYADLSVWCYKCDNYIDTRNPVLLPISQAAQMSKFGILPMM